MKGKNSPNLAKNSQKQDLTKQDLLKQSTAGFIKDGKSKKAFTAKAHKSSPSKPDKKAIIYGCGRRGRQLVELIDLDYEILGFVDEICKDKSLEIAGISYPILPENSLLNKGVDKIFIALNDLEASLAKLDKMGVCKDKLDASLWHFAVRVDFIRSLSANFAKYDIKGSCAELGVFQGDFARFINKFFPSKLYLLDTFSGFDERDIKSEIQSQNACTQFLQGEFSDTSIALVHQKLPNPERVEFIKGYFPQSVSNRIPKDEKFAFVNLDMDLEAPILAGLEYFYKRLVKGGVVLIDDYYHLRFLGAMKAVDNFATKNALIPYPIGDGRNVFFVKN